jgi:uncharacterized damage-inducible protein DinB
LKTVLSERCLFEKWGFFALCTHASGTHALQSNTNMKKLEDYRKGAIGAMMDEYERASLELKSIVEKVNEEDYERIADTDTKNEDCRSIQTVMSHVVFSGFEYFNIFREQLSLKAESIENEQISHAEIGDRIINMLSSTEKTLDGNWELKNEEIDKLVSIMPWGTPYNLEQILEHAIVHILRHRRQIDKFLIRFAEEN